MKILVTGGAGFIGTHLIRALVNQGYAVRVLDALVEQVHGANGRAALNLPGGVEFIEGDVRDISVWREALQDCDAVYHLAAEVGVGQSMYEIVRYVSANTMGTANMLQVLADGAHGVRKIVVASSMSIYGEGAYACPSCGPVVAQIRGLPQLEARDWEARCPTCGEALAPIPTGEDKPLQPTSVYAISKRDQEELCLSIGRAYDIPTTALRFFNVYGPGQALSNPYTGVAAIFASRLLGGSPPLIFEDGRQTRDFVHVSDIVQSLILALERDEADYEVFNIGSGQPRTVLEIARALAHALDVAVEPVVVNQFREGDIRHCVAEIRKARELLGFEPRARFEDRLTELAEWVRQQTVVDRVDAAKAELERRGLTR